LFEKSELMMLARGVHENLNPRREKPKANRLLIIDEKRVNNKLAVGTELINTVKNNNFAKRGDTKKERLIYDTIVLALPYLFHITMSDGDDAALQAMRQKLMTADEVYVYKIPPLKSAGGHRCVARITICIATVPYVLLLLSPSPLT
jgi:hypothetical protein